MLKAKYIVLFSFMFMAVSPRRSQEVRLTRVDKEWGISARGLGPHGCSVIDFDKDGDLDIYITNFWNFTPGRIFNQFFMQGPIGTFTDRAPDWQMQMKDAHTHDGVWLDYDGDGDMDLFVAATIGRHRLFRNNGNGFEDVTDQAGLGGFQDTGARAVVAGDFNGDGWTDIFVQNNAPAIGTGVGPANHLFINQRDGTFVDEAEARGIADPRPLLSFFQGLGQGATEADFDEDGDLDIVTCIRFLNPRLFVNDGTGHFSEEAIQRGVVVPEGCDGATFGDLDNDGDLDLITIRALSHSFVRFFYNDGTGHFVDRTAEMNVEGLAFTPVLVDLNLDGYLDLFFARSNRFVGVFLNREGQRFEQVAPGTGFVGFDPRATCAADYDNDGDEDLLIVHTMDNFRLFRNDWQGRVVKINLRGWKMGGGDLYGTKVWMFDPFGRLRFYTEITSSYGYLAHRPPDEIIIGAPDGLPRFVRIRFPWGLEVSGPAFPVKTNRK